MPHIDCPTSSGSAQPIHRSRSRVLPRLTVATLVALAVFTTAAAASAQAPPGAAPPSTAPATAGGGGADANATFGVGPANAKGLDGRPSFTYTANPGASLTDSVALVNLSNAPLTLGIHVTDVVAGNNGAADLPTTAETPTATGTWFTLSPPNHDPNVAVPARSSVVIPFTVAVPKEAAPGDHSAGIVASIIGDARSANGDVVHLDQRVATRAFLRVSGDLAPKLSVEDLHASYDGTWNPVGRGGVTLSYTVHNTGNVRLGAKQGADFRGLFGATATAAGLPDIPVLLPGGSVTETARIDGVWPQIIGTASVHLTPAAAPGDVDPQLPVVYESVRAWTIPWALLALLVVLAAGAWWLRRQRRRRGARLAVASAKVTDRVAVPT
jgi:hypothetical protein